MHGERESPIRYHIREMKILPKRREDEKGGTEAPIRPKPLSSSLCPSQTLNIVSSSPGSGRGGDSIYYGRWVSENFLGYWLEELLNSDLIKAIFGYFLDDKALRVKG